MNTNMKLGKGAVKVDRRTLKLGSYLTSALPPAPQETNLTAKITNLGVMLNDTLGDCTCAAVGHTIQQWTAESGTQIILSDSIIESLYEAVGGYVKGDPTTDNGAVELDVLNYWKKNKVAGHTLAAYVSVNPHKIEEVKNAVYYFGNAYIGVQLPISAQDQDIWDVVPDDGKGDSEPGSWGGHAIIVCAYDVNYLYVITWGAIKKVTYAWFNMYCDEAYALLSSDWLNPTSGKSPEGFDLATLQADLKSVTA